MDIVSYSVGAKAKKWIKKFISEPDSDSGVVTLPTTIATGESISIPLDRQAIMAELTIDGDITVDGVLEITGSNSTSVEKSGDTMTGNLEAPSMSIGGNFLSPYSHRNKIINGEVTRINQRGFDGSNWVDGQYTYDRWKATATAMTQTIEDGNYKYSTEYTLSGTGITTAQITSPASGNWTIPELSRTARNIQLEEGSVATPFEQRPIGYELSLCQRYYWSLGVAYLGFSANSTNASNKEINICLPTTMRVPAHTITQAVTSGTITDTQVGTTYIFLATDTATGSNCHLTSFTADAEL